MRSLCVMQPTYLPWLGYFELMRQADVFVIYDHVQFSKQSWQQRNRIRSQDKELMLTVPVFGGLGQRIADVRIDRTQKFTKKHLASIEMNYRKSKNFDRYFFEIEQIYARNHDLLVELNVDLIMWGAEKLGVSSHCQFLRSSQLHVQGKKVEALIDLCRELQVDRYYSPKGAMDYIEDNNLFIQAGIQLEYQDFQHPHYQQLQYTDFIGSLAFIDYLFNDGGQTPF
jgi:hypothetical protein